jgi:CubicO group peptidase (beta-lactamase class C family)
MKQALYLSLVSAALLGACAAQPKLESRTATAQSAAPADATRLRQAGAEVLFWNQEQRDANFRRMEKIFPSNIVPAGGRARPLPAGPSLEPTLGAEAVDEFIAAQNIAGLIVLQDGRVRLERYARGFAPDQRWTSFSVAKSLTSSLVGAAVRDGFIKSLDDPVIRYVPELAGTAYDGVTVRQVLTMSSGVRWNEDYRDPTSDVAQMFSTPPAEGLDVTISYLRKLPREAEPGTRWNYNTAETNLIGVILSRAVGRPIARYASEKIWKPYGMEADAYWQLDERGHEIAGCCLSARLRDYARIGQFMLDDGKAGGRQVLPAGWVTEATRMQQSFPGGRAGYGYQWWTSPYGYAARGIFGQTIWIDPKRRLVIAALSAWPSATDRELGTARDAFFRRIAQVADEPLQPTRSR